MRRDGKSRVQPHLEDGNFRLPETAFSSGMLLELGQQRVPNEIADVGPRIEPEPKVTELSSVRTSFSALSLCPR
jgi:hypothetical protein